MRITIEAGQYEAEDGILAHVVCLVFREDNNMQRRVYHLMHAESKERAESLAGRTRHVLRALKAAGMRVTLGRDDVSIDVGGSGSENIVECSRLHTSCKSRACSFSGRHLEGAEGGNNTPQGMMMGRPRTRYYIDGDPREFRTEEEMVAAYRQLL